MNSALTPAQAARAGGALVLANLRYWTSVAPRVRAQLARWELRARAIADPGPQALALGKLREESFNAEVAATLATLAPRTRREDVVEAIVALQVAYDYFDVLLEQPPDDPLRIGDGNYLRELAGTIEQALERLPSRDAIAEVARRAACRSVQAQLLSHAATSTGEAELESWARGEAADSVLCWPEYLAGAQASVLAVHALIAAAAEEHATREQAERIDAAYLLIGAITMLDSVIDREQDLAGGGRGHVRYYANPEQMGLRLAAVAHEAMGRAHALPHAAHHAMTLTGVVAYYASAPAASDAFARPAIACVRRELRPLIAPTLAVMRGWRLAKSTHAWLRHTHSTRGA
jgi:tetraprenyl-beta-curcumene synthase